MNKNDNEMYTLSDGVKIGNIGNPIVYSPLHGSVIVDENTHLFLLNLSENHDICIDTSEVLPFSAIFLYYFGSAEGHEYPVL